jgi:hypothetical protein
VRGKNNGVLGFRNFWRRCVGWRCLGRTASLGSWFCRRIGFRRHCLWWGFLNFSFSLEFFLNGGLGLGCGSLITGGHGAATIAPTVDLTALSPVATVLSILAALRVLRILAALRVLSILAALRVLSILAALRVLRILIALRVLRILGIYIKDPVIVLSVLKIILRSDPVP